MKAIAILGLVALTACTSAPQADIEPKPLQDVLLLRTSSGSAALDLDSHEVRPLLDPLIRTGKGSTLFASVREEGKTRIVALDPRSDTSRDVSVIPGDFEVAVASPDGQAVVLAPSGSRSVTDSVPQGRSRTNLVQVQSSGATRNFDLMGNFQPEAFSTDGSRLFLIEYLPAAAPDRYSVRELDLRTGRVSPVGGKLKQPAPDEMRGTGRLQARAPDGKVLYTLYTRQVETYPHGEPTETDPRADHPVHSFVHVLNLEQGWAHCVDLPHPFGMSSTGDDAIAVSADGSVLYVVDGTAGAVAKVETDRLQVTRTRSVDLPSGGPDVSLLVQGGSLFLSAGPDVHELDAKTMATIKRSTLEVAANSLAPFDESRLFVGYSDGVILFDPERNRTVERYNVTGLLGIASI